MLRIKFGKVRPMLLLAALIAPVGAINAQRSADLPPANPTRAVSPATKSYDRVPPDAVWKGLLAAYRTAGIKATITDPARYEIVYIASPAGSKVGNMKIENAFDCGGDKKAPLAKSLELAVNVRSVVRPVGDGAEVTTAVEARALTPSADGSPPPSCITRNALERKLNPEIKLAFVVR